MQTGVVDTVIDGDTFTLTTDEIIRLAKTRGVRPRISKSELRETSLVTRRQNELGAQNSELTST